VLGRNCRFLKHPDSDPVVLESIRDAIREQRLFKGVLLNRRKDGTLYRNSLIVSPVFDEHGVLINFVGLSEDVTARYEAQEALQSSEKRYVGMVANVPGAIYRARRRADGTLSFLYVSEGCRKMFGVAPELFLSDKLTLQRMIQPADRQSYQSGALSAAQPNNPPQPWHWRGRFVLPSGEEKVIEDFAHPDPQDNGDVIWDGLLMDITDRVLAEQQAAQLAAIVEGSSDAIIGKTLDGTITSWNAAAEMMYGYTAQEMIGQSITRLLPPDRPNEVDHLLQRIARGESVPTFQTVRHAKEGTPLDIALTVSPTKARDGSITGASAIARDIRQDKEAEAQIERQIQRIQALRSIDLAITGSLDLRVTLNILLDQVTTHLRVDGAAVLLLNSHTHRLEYVVGRGFRTTALQGTHLRVGEGYAGRAALERRLISVPNLAHDKGDFTYSPLFDAEGFVSYWATPLITKGRVGGVLEVFHRAPLHPASDWVNFLGNAGRAGSYRHRKRRAV
jgi:PAS domain S-box-containing protein